MEAVMRYASILCVAAILAVPALARAQDGHDHASHDHGVRDGYQGVGHDTWHENFYSKLIRNDTRTSCCNMSDCRPTESRMIGDHYEVKIDGVWVVVPKETIQKLSAPDGGAHVCAPKQNGRNRGTIYCVVLPPET